MRTLPPSSENIGASVPLSATLSGILQFRRSGSAVGNAHPIVMPGGIEERQTGSGLGSPMHRLDLVAQLHRCIRTQIHRFGAAQPQLVKTLASSTFNGGHLLHCGNVADLAFRTKRQLVSRHVLANLPRACGLRLARRIRWPPTALERSTAKA